MRTRHKCNESILELIRIKKKMLWTFCIQTITQRFPISAFVNKIVDRIGMTAVNGKLFETASTKIK